MFDERITDGKVIKIKWREADIKNEGSIGWAAEGGGTNTWRGKRGTTVKRPPMEGIGAQRDTVRSREAVKREEESDTGECALPGFLSSPTSDASIDRVYRLCAPIGVRRWFHTSALTHPFLPIFDRSDRLVLVSAPPNSIGAHPPLIDYWTIHYWL